MMDWASMKKRWGIKQYSVHGWFGPGLFYNRVTGRRRSQDLLELQLHTRMNAFINLGKSRRSSSNATPVQIGNEE